MPFPERVFSKEWARFREVDFAWLAAMVEGEGWIGIRKNGYGLLFPLVAVSNTDAKIIEKVSRMFENKPWGQVAKGVFKSTKKVYTVRLSGGRALVILRRIEPYMVGEKRQLAESIMAKFEPPRVPIVR